MLDFDKISIEDQQELMSTIQKNVEKSELDKFYLFTIDNIEKAKLYIWCYRFLNGINNVLAEGNTKEIVTKELGVQQDLYITISSLIFQINKTHMNKNRNLTRLKDVVVADKRVDEMIDAFALLLERQNILSMSRIKGIILDGPSGKEFARVFNSKISETQNLAQEDNLVETEEEPKEEPEEQTTLEPKEEPKEESPEELNEEVENEEV